MNFCTTATIRPELLDETYRSFRDNLLGINLRHKTLFINIDPSPFSSIKYRKKTIKVAQKYFGTVVANCPKTSNFTAAINWLWQTAQSEHIFQLEDDWKLNKQIDVPLILKEFSKNPNLLAVRLRWKLSDKFAFGLSPGVLSYRFYKHYAGKLNIKKNPEIQLSHDLKIEDPRVNFNLIQWPDFVVVEDTGRRWREKRGIQILDSKGRPGTPRTFTVWDK